MKRLIAGLALAVLVALAPSAALADDLPCTVFGTDGDDIWTVVPKGDWVFIPYDAVVCGGDGDDVIMGGAFQGTFYGGKGDDGVQSSRGATFYGGDGGDWMGDNLGSFYGGDGNDSVYKNYGEFYGGDGEDVVVFAQTGIFVQGD